MSGSMNLHKKRYICADISAAELLSFPPFLEVRCEERNWARTRDLCLTHSLCNDPFQVAMKIEVWNDGLDVLLLCMLSFKTWTPYFGNLNHQGTWLEYLSHHKFPWSQSAEGLPE